MENNFILDALKAELGSSATQTVENTCDSLIRIIRHRFITNPHAIAILDGFENHPENEQWRTLLQEELHAIEADKDNEIVNAAQAVEAKVGFYKAVMTGQNDQSVKTLNDSTYRSVERYNINTNGDEQSLIIGSENSVKSIKSEKNSKNTIVEGDQNIVSKTISLPFWLFFLALVLIGGVGFGSSSILVVQQMNPQLESAYQTVDDLKDALKEHENELLVAEKNISTLENIQVEQQKKVEDQKTTIDSQNSELETLRTQLEALRNQPPSESNDSEESPDAPPLGTASRSACLQFVEMHRIAEENGFNPSDEILRAKLGENNCGYWDISF